MKVSSLSAREPIQAYKYRLRSFSLTEVLATRRIPSVDGLLDVVHEFIKGEISVQSKREHLEGRSGDTKGKKPFRADRASSHYGNGYPMQDIGRTPPQSQGLHKTYNITLPCSSPPAPRSFILLNH